MNNLASAVNNETFISSVAFTDDTLEITFTEDREVGEEEMMARVLVMRINNEERLQLVLEIQERLRDLVEWGYVAIRNPPKQFSLDDHRRDRLSEDQVVDED